MKKSVGIIIVNYYCQDLIIECIASLKKHVDAHQSYIVVDNSEKEDFDRLGLAHPDAEIIYGHGNIGFAGGCNLGMRMALSLGRDYVLLLNPDTYTKNDFISVLVGQMEKNTTLGIVGPKIILDDEKSIWYAGARMAWWHKGPVHLFEDMGESDNASFCMVPFISGCAMLLRVKAVKQVGLMDERYFLYFEDADYSQLFIRAGWGIAYVSGAEVYHRLSATTDRQSEKYTFYLSRNRILFLRRWAKWYQFLFYMLLNTFVKVPGAVIVFGIIRRRSDLMRAYLRGYREGLKNE